MNENLKNEYKERKLNELKKICLGMLITGAISSSTIGCAPKEVSAQPIEQSIAKSINEKINLIDSLIPFVSIVTDSKVEESLIKVIEANYEESHIELIPRRVNDKLKMVPFPIPEKYEVIVEYNGEQFHLNGKDIYNEYKDKVGKECLAYIKTDYLSNGNISNDFYSIKNEETVYKLETEHGIKTFKISSTEETNKYNYYNTDYGYKIKVKKDGSSCEVINLLNSSKSETYKNFKFEEDISKENKQNKSFEF